MLAKLAGKTVSLDGAGGGFGAIKPEDIAAALSGTALSSSGKLVKLPDGAMLIGLAKWAGINRCRWQLEDVLYDKVKLFAQIKRWGNNPLILRRLSNMAISEVMGGVCSTCNGKEALETGLTYILVNNQAVVCPDCSGSGAQVITPEIRAQRANINQSEWTNSWSSRYEIIYKVVSGWDRQVRYHLHQRFGSD